MILGPNDPNAITGEELDEARAYTHTERFNEEVLGLRPLTKRQREAKDRKLAKVLADIGWADVYDLADTEVARRVIDGGAS